MTNFRSNLKLSRVFRRLTFMVAALFALLALVAPAFHNHEAGGMVRMSPTVWAHAATPAFCPLGHHHGPHDLTHQQHFRAAPHSSSASDHCSLCDWAAGGVPVSIVSAPAFEAVSAHSAPALLLLAVRFAALCQRPLPHQGLRAPPFLTAALVA